MRAASASKSSSRFPVSLPATKAAAYRVRRAGEADTAALLRLQRQFYLEDAIVVGGAERRAAIERLRANDSLGGLWLVEAGSDAVAYVALCYGFSLAVGGRDAFIDEIFVLPEHRRQGIGRMLLEQAVEAGKAAGVRAFSPGSEGRQRTSPKIV